MTKRLAFVLVVLSPLAAVAACSDLGGLTGGDADAAADVATDQVAPPTDDGSIREAGIADVDPDAVVNPTAGLGVFVLHGIPQPEGGPLVAPARIEPGDASLRTLDCPRANQSAAITTQGVYPDPLGPWAMRVFHEPTDPSRAKFVYPRGVGGGSSSLLLVDESSSCDGGKPPRDLSAGVPGSQLSPAFSDDGKRIAWLSSDGLRFVRVNTAATEGDLEQEILQNFTADQGSALAPAPPIWIRDVEGLKVAWVEIVDGTVLVRLKRDQALGAPAVVLLECGQIFVNIQQLGLFRGVGGKTLIAFNTQLNDPDAGAPSQRAIYTVDYQLPCSSRTLLFDDVPESYSADFMIAPDGERMAHVANRAVVPDAGVGKRRIWIGSVSARTRKVCTDPPDGTYDVGPQWIAGGSQIVWTRRSNAGPDAVIMIADVAGDVCTNARALTATSSGAISHTAKNGCAAGASSPGSARWSALLFAALFLVTSRRRAERPRSGCRR